MSNYGDRVDTSYDLGKFLNNCIYTKYQEYVIKHCGTSLISCPRLYPLATNFLKFPMKLKGTHIKPFADISGAEN